MTLPNDNPINLNRSIIVEEPYSPTIGSVYH